METKSSPFHIAVIEDEKPMADLIADILHKFEPLIELFETGKAFLKCTSMESFTHVVMDLSLPDLDGIELMPHLTRLPHTCTILLISGHSEHVIQAAAFYGKALGFMSIKTLRKPFSASELRAALGLLPRESTLV